jgi:hypothetical protein
LLNVKLVVHHVTSTLEKITQYTINTFWQMELQLHAFLIFGGGIGVSGQLLASGKGACGATTE